MIYTKAIFEKHKVSEQDMQFAMSLYEPMSLKANEFFLKEGEVSNYVALVMNGLLRSYVFDDNANEITQQFYPEDTLVISFDSFNNHVSAKENIKALTDASLRVISFEKQSLLYEKVPAWKQICLDIADMNSHEMMNRVREFQTKSATERYHKFCKEYPEILQRATLGNIATYIGADNATLSRIRRKK